MSTIVFEELTVPTDEPAEKLIIAQCIKSINGALREHIVYDDFINRDAPDWYCYPEFELNDDNTISLHPHDYPDNKLISAVFTTYYNIVTREKKVNWFPVVFDKYSLVLDSVLGDGTTILINPVLAAYDHNAIASAFADFMELVLSKCYTRSRARAKFELQLTKSTKWSPVVQATGFMVFINLLWRNHIKGSSILETLSKYIKMAGYNISLYDYCQLIDTPTPEKFEELGKLSCAPYQVSTMSKWNPK